MIAKLHVTSTFLLSTASLLSAQTSVAGHLGASDPSDTIRQLEHNALLALTGAVVLAGIGWICSIFNACASINKSPKNRRKPFLGFLLLSIGLSAFCSSCSVQQQAIAARNEAVAATRNCPMNQHLSNQAYSAYKNRYPSNQYSNWQGPAFCRYCGKRLPVGN